MKRCHIRVSTRNKPQTLKSPYTFGSTSTGSQKPTSGERLEALIADQDEIAVTFEELVNSVSFSGRAEHSILKLSRTIADLEGSENVKAAHIAEAFEFRKNEGGLDICF